MEIIKKVFDALMMVMHAALVAMWMAHIIILFCHGEMHGAFNEIIMFTLVILSYSATRRMERMAKVNALLAEEVQKLEDVKIFVQSMRDIVKKTEAEQQVAEKTEEHLEPEKEKEDDAR